MMMSKKRLLGVAFAALLSINAFAAKPKVNQDSLKIVELTAKVDTLTKQLEQHSIEENFYESALSTQTATYGVIVTIALLGIGLISYAGFRLEVKRLKEDYEKAIHDQQARLIAQRQEFEEYQTGFYKEASNLRVITSEMYANSLPSVAIVSRLRSAEYALRAGGHSIAFENLKLASSQLTKATFKPADLRYFQRTPSMVSEILQFISTHQIATEDIVLECARLRVSFHEKLGMVPVPTPENDTK